MSEAKPTPIRLQEFSVSIGELWLTPCDLCGADANEVLEVSGRCVRLGIVLCRACIRAFWISTGAQLDKPSALLR